MSARTISKRSSVIPWLVLGFAVALTIIGVSWRARAVSRASDSALASAEGHFSDVVNDHERRLGDAQRELALVLLGAGTVHAEAHGVSEVAERLERLEVSNLEGLSGFALIPADSAPATIEGFGSGLDGDVVSALSDIAASSPLQQTAPWVALLDVGDEESVVTGLNIDGGSLVAVFEAGAFLLGASDHGAHHVMASLEPPSVARRFSADTADMDDDMTGTDDHGMDEHMTGTTDTADMDNDMTGMAGTTDTADMDDDMTGMAGTTDTADMDDDMTGMAGMADGDVMMADARFTSSSTVDVFGQPWTLNVHAMSGFLETPSSQEVKVIAALGALLSAMLFVLMNRLIKSLRVELENLAAQEELRTTGERFEVGFDRSPIGVAELDDAGRIVKVNEALATLLGRNKAKLVGSHLSDLVADQYQADSRRRLRSVAERTETERRAEVCYEVDDGHPLWVQESASSITGPDGTGHVLVQIVDFTEERRTREELQRRALHDELTGLPNRALLEDRIAQALRRGRRNGTLTAAMFIDVDRFKHVNDTLGHNSGDVLLQDLADRLTSNARESDTVARFGGDEFVMLCEDLRTPSEAMGLADRLRAAIAEPIDGGDRSTPITVSMGIALGAQEDDQEALLRDADLAMYQAKADGRDCVVMFEREMRESLLDRVALEDELRHVIGRDELRVHYQPLLHLETNAIVGFEALVRWQHPTRGLLAPAEFLHIAEHGILTDIDEWILRTATSQLASWRSDVADAAAWTVAVNASPWNFGDTSYPNLVRETLAEAGLSPDRLTIELTEQAVLSNAEIASQVIADLRELGVRVAIDDFGTGYSSFSQLAALDVDILKIDRSFVSTLHEESGAEIVYAVIQMARALGLTTVAEGAETVEDLDRLQTLGSDVVQGYAIAKPMAPEAVLATVASLRREASPS